MTEKSSKPTRVRTAVEAALRVFSRGPVAEPERGPAIAARRVVVERPGTPRKLRPEPPEPAPRRLAIGPYAPAPPVDGNTVLAFRPYTGQTMNLFRDDFVG